MLIELRKRTDEESENFNKEKNVRKYQMKVKEMTNTVTEMEKKNTLEGFTGR